LQKSFQINPIKVVLFGILFFCTRTVFSQIRSEFDLALEEKNVSEKKIDSILELIEIKNSDSISFIYFDYANWLSTRKNNTKAFLIAKKAFQLTKKNEDDQLQFRAFVIGFLGTLISQDYEAIEYYEKSLDFNENRGLELRTFTNLAYLYQKTNQHLLSVKYWDILIDHYLITENPSGLKKAYYYSADVLSKLEDVQFYRKGKEYIAKADSLATLTKTSDKDFYAIKHIGAQLYNKNETLNIPKAESFLFASLKRSQLNRDSLNIALSYAILGNLYNSTNKLKSLRSLENSLKFTDKKDTVSLLNRYSNIGYTYSYYNDFEKGLDNKIKTLELALNVEILDESETIPKYLVYKSSHKKSLQYILPSVAEIYLKKYTFQNNAVDLVKSLEFFSLADYTITLLQKSSNEFQSRLHWRKLGSDIYNKAIKASYLKNDPELAFYYMEKNKMLLLLQDINLEKYKSTLNLPKTVSQEQQKIKEELLVLENKLNTSSSDKTYTVKEEILSKERRLQKLNDSLGIYTNLPKVDNQIIPLKKLQKLVDPDEIRISYHASSDDGYGIYSNKTNGYLIYVTQDHSQLIEITELDVLEEDVRRLVNSFKNPLNASSDIEKQNILSHSIYKRLFPTEDLRQLIAGKRLIISPDNFLSFLPFEALKTSVQSDDYLINDAEISYAPSHSFLNSLDGSSNQKKPSFLGVAPVTFTETELPKLSFSQNEIEGLNTHYKGTSLLNKEASKSAFLNQLDSASIIHLSTHAGAQDDYGNPWIAFADEQMDSNELNLLKNDASLVFLSACETNLGEIERGEGVMNLARGFFYGGAQSVISTLWNIDDRSTATIVDNFYKNLSDGKTKSASLREAKLNYLSNSSLSEKSPYYWSSFVLLGDNSSIPAGGNNWIYLFAIGIILALLIFLFKRRKSIFKKTGQYTS